jgi:hypothetical protein
MNRRAAIFYWSHGFFQHGEREGKGEERRESGEERQRRNKMLKPSMKNYTDCGKKGKRGQP